MDRSPAQVFVDQHVRPRAGRTLIVGSRVYEGREDRRTMYADAVGLDMLAGEGVDVVANLEEPQPQLGVFDHVECCSVLEHSRRPWLLAENLAALMAPGATLYLTVPWVWRSHGYPEDHWRMTRSGVRSIFPRIEWKALMVASDQLRDDDYLRGIGKAQAAHPYMPRAEVVGFGVRV